MIARVHSGRVALPDAVLQALHLAPGDSLLLDQGDGCIVIRRVEVALRHRAAAAEDRPNAYDPAARSPAP